VTLPDRVVVQGDEGEDDGQNSAERRSQHREASLFVVELAH
jgi:hypothetical protein